MKYRPSYPFHAILFICVLVFHYSCAKDSDLFTDYIIEENPEYISVIDLENALRIPSDFDWTNIPEGYENTVWEITGSFDLEEASIRLPEGVTLYFNGGELTNGTLTGSETLIASQGSSQVFDAISLTGTFENDYIMPYWFGAAMDGVTDDREAFVATLAHANTLGLKVLVEKDIFLDVEETGTKSIFLEDNTWIEGANDVNIIVNQILSPAFQGILADGITIKNVTFLYDNAYNASTDFTNSDRYANNTAIKNYMETYRNVVFESGVNAKTISATDFTAMFLFDASKNITFDGVNFVAKGDTADTFILMGIKFKEQYADNQTITSSGGTTDICRNVTLTNMVLDGVIMGIQGPVIGLAVDGLNSFRYSDVQTAQGTNIGWVNYTFPPPHLFYLNEDGSLDYDPSNISIRNVYDHGKYVGNSDVRGGGGYCNSLKLIGASNVYVDNYKSFRRDGLGDLGGITNGVFKNIYAESTIDIFNPTFGFTSLRFVGDLTNVTFENMTIKDNSEILERYPLDVTGGDYVTMDNVHVYVNELLHTPHGPFGISGSNNTILNSSLNIQNHTGTETYKAVVYHNNETLDNGANNHYEIEVNGWRDISDDPEGLSIRMLLQYASNTNDNYAKIIDTANGFTIEQESTVKQDAWTRTEEVELGSGTSQLLNLNIPRNLYVQRVNLTTLEALEDGLEVYLSTSGNSTSSNSWLTEISAITGSISKTFSSTTAHTSSQALYLVANDDFDNQGKILVELVLGRTTVGN
ncbi:hypothetical protein [Maribacter arenosus]|uniref:Right handed beta helix region n=1 Tax=Maribacter arenosus TaxID=1854708 RepID=A0ABR7VAU8_9FLAO|nr:hypothetical protein [Maribacter arenosus]MBD0850789.1 hypothetical protein [Maribacter arenosus]